MPAEPLFLIATLAAAIPVVLHMINRQKAKELPFSTLRFLRISVQKTRRRKRIHDLLLMVIRAAVLALIAVGLAEPTLTNLSSLWGGADTAVAIILDNSASMGAVDQGEVRFRTALRAAEQIMDELREGDQVALFLTGGPVLPELGTLDHTHEKVRQILGQWLAAPSKTSGVSYQRADLVMKLQQARTLLANSDAPNKQIYVLSDLQKLSWEGTPSGADPSDAETGPQSRDPQPSPPPEQETAEDAAAPKAKPSDDGAARAADDAQMMKIPVILVDCHRTPAPNVAVDDVSPSAAVPVAGLPIMASVELFNAATVAQPRRVELYIDGRKEQSSPVLDVPPGGRLRHELTFTPTRSGLHRGEVRLVGEDGSALDDRRFFAVEVDQGIPVAVVKPQRHEIPYLEDTFYVEQALAPGKAGAWAIRTTPLTADDLLAEPLADYKVVFCVNLPALRPETAGRLRAYVAAGGNLVWICGDNVDPAAYTQMDRQAGGELLPATLSAVRTAGGLSQFSGGLSQFSRSENGTVPFASGASDCWRIGFFDPAHPALGPLAEPATLYESVLVYKHVQIDVAEPSGAWVMARLDDGQPLLLQRNVGRGKVLMLGTGAHVDWSNLPLRPIFLPLLVQLTYNLAGVEQSCRALLAGSPLLLPLKQPTRPTGVEIVRPDGEMIRRKTEDQQGQPLHTFRYDDTHQIGIYQLRLLQSGQGRPIACAVNVDPDEADDTKIEPGQIEKLLAPAPLVFAEDPDDLSATFSELREGKSLWELFLTGVLLALVFETLLANRLSPKPQETTPAQPPPRLRRLAKRRRGVA